MQTVKQLILHIAAERKLFLDQLINITELQAQWKPNPDDWNITENTEHLFWAEQGGILGMWKTIHSSGRKTAPDSVHRLLNNNLTWQPKEIVPTVAAPRMGGPLNFWITSLDGLQDLLNAFGQDLQDDELRLQAHPHPISGAMDFHQRLNLPDRHRKQVAALLVAMK
ncbi:MAG: DinB family protein [Chitinophagaceae bacterium]|nr:DinB family protein [Chitinophagaceae bacterium]